MKIRLSSLLLMIVAVAVLLASCQQSDSVRREGPPQVLTAALTLGPGGGEQEIGRPWTGGAGHTVHAKLYLTPAIMSEDLNQIIPHAAESWTANSDFTQWTFRLRDDLRWSDGTPLTAHDWKFTAEYVTSPDFASQNMQHRIMAFSEVIGYQSKLDGNASELEGFVVLDDHTVQMSLSAPSPRFYANQYRTYILPAHAIDFSPADHLTTNWWLDSSRQVGSGPFVMGDFERDEFVTLERNEHYFEGAPILERIIIPFFGGNITNGVLALLSGQIDFSYVEPTDLSSIGSDFQMFSGPSNVIVFTDIRFPNVPEFWQDIRVRQAVMYAIDRQRIVEEVFEGTHYVIPSPVGFEAAWAPDLNWFEYDPQRALELLSEAGVNPSQIRMEWVSHSGYDNLQHNAAMQTVQSYLEAIGITMTYRFLDVPAWRAFYTNEGPWTFGYRGASAPLSPHEFSRNYTNTGAQGGTRFKGFDMIESGFEAVLDRLNTASTNEEYLAALTELSSLHNRLLPDLPLWTGIRYGAASNRLKNFWWQPASGGGPYYDRSHLWEVIGN